MPVARARGPGLDGRVDVVLLVLGARAIAGTWVTGLLVDRRLRALTLPGLAGLAVAAPAFGGRPLPARRGARRRGRRPAGFGG